MAMSFAKLGRKLAAPAADLKKTWSQWLLRLPVQASMSLMLSQLPSQLRSAGRRWAGKFVKSHPAFFQGSP